MVNPKNPQYLPKCTPFLNALLPGYHYLITALFFSFFQISDFRFLLRLSTAKAETGAHPAESGTRPVSVNRGTKILREQVRVLLEETRVIDSLSSESTLYLLLNLPPKPLRRRFHVAERWNRRDIHVIVVS